MSGLEIAALIPAIVSAITAISAEFRSWRQKRKERSAKSENVELKTLLHESSSVVQSKYDTNLQRLGEDFKRGDSIGREALMEHLIVLQTTVISLLRGQNINITDLIHPNHSLITRGTKSARDGTISALSQQYQRLAQADPIPRLPPATSEPPAEDTHHSSTCPYRNRNSCFHDDDFRNNCFGEVILMKHGFGHNIHRLNCEECGWEGPAREELTRIGFKTRDRIRLCNYMVWEQFHRFVPAPHSGRPRYDENGYRCYICGHEMKNGTRCEDFGVSYEKLMRHIRREHFADEIERPS
ncbi:hypothetical protein N7478_004940 [Penicillium angulare]|uniref:uncharacterized protein n=1 Tax=Penicillium angulare TaxID=116970 RepID=UPI0025404ADC|nr:uncharacterized protein N7478_004940 [Penicillium angulare]KAJ5279568.1 hypothetical protein N7478_004940 [Penicillium angulare]